jgi:hypothetical protein
VKDETFISRWSRKKTEARSAPPAPEAIAPPEQPAPVAAPVTSTADAVPEPAATLQSIESLTPESDFTPFMKPEVDEGVKRQALKQLFRDPQFNVMDGLDVYIDDYSKPDPLPEGWLEKLNMVKRLGIFTEPVEPAPSAAAETEALQKTMDEQPVAPLSEADPADTSVAAIPPPLVGKSELSRE